jgi:hypothetical protein
VKLLTSFLRAWWHSCLGAYTAGHFHVTWGLVLGAIVVLLGGLMTCRARPRPAVAPVRDHPLTLFLVVAGAAGGVALYADTHQAPVAKAPKPVTRTVIQRHTTTIIQHAAAAHSPVSGTDIVLIIAGCLVAFVAVAAITRRSE